MTEPWSGLVKVAYEQIVSDFLASGAREAELMDAHRKKHEAWLAEQSLAFRLRYKGRKLRARAVVKWDDFRCWLSNKIYAHQDAWY